MTKQEHLDWAKARAQEYLDAGEAFGAINSLLSDLTKHPETRGLRETLPPDFMVRLMVWPNEPNARELMKLLTS